MEYLTSTRRGTIRCRSKQERPGIWKKELLILSHNWEQGSEMKRRQCSA